MDKWLTDLTVEELKERILSKPYKPFEIDGIPVFMNMDNKLLKDEIFKKHPELSVEVSNFGRVKFNKNILPQTPDENKPEPNGYLLVKFENESKLVYRLVAETWCDRFDPKYNTVHHISNNGMDNRVSNLLWVTPEQHREIHPFFLQEKHL